MQGYGAGPQPWEYLLERRAHTTRVTLQGVSETMDGGEIAGRSPLINVKLVDGTPSDDVRLVGEKTLLPMAGMVTELVRRIVSQKGSGLIGPIRDMTPNKFFRGTSGRDSWSP